jgi:exopolyphosphatase/guanosine-5'-triphosphate,3'-diphosphate pyrophosphatase
MAANVAVVDIGSNSTRLLVAEREGDRIVREVVRETNVTRLGQGVDADGRLAQEAMDRVFTVLDRYRTVIDEHDCAASVAVLTSAVRDSANGQQFADSIKSTFALEPHILSGDEEARLTYLGATSDRAAANTDTAPTLVVDIGGGSTEMVIGCGHEVTFHVSTQAGVVRQSERHLHTDPPSAAELDTLRADVRAIIADGVPADRRAGVQHGIAVAGTATSLAAIAQQLDPYDPERVHGYRLDREEARRILDRLAAMPLARRRDVAGLHPDRAPTIVAGVVIFLEVLELFGLARIEVSEHDILRGAALGLISFR